VTSPTLSARLRHALPRRVHLVMRDGTMLEGHIMIGEDQALVPYLNGRRGGWMNVTRAHRPKLGEPPGHVIVQSENIVLAMAPDHDVQIAVVPTSGVEERRVEMVLLGGKVVHGSISAASQQRLSDYVSSQAGKFMGLQHAALMPEGRTLGDVAVHMLAIEMVKDLREGIEEAPTNIETA
jgi:hypothetical protein